MTLDLLDILLVLQFVLEKQVPWWLWVLGVIATIGNNYRMNHGIKTIVSFK